MRKFPAKYTQLPNYEHEYRAIIDYIENEVSTKDLEGFIATLKGSIIKAKYKHRTHLENLGLIYKNENGNVSLTQIGMDVKSGKITLQDGLLNLVVQNNELSGIFVIIERTGYFEGKINKKQLSKHLSDNYYWGTDEKTINRYLRELLNLYNIIEFIKLKKYFEQDLSLTNLDITLNNLKSIYLKCAKEYGKPIPLDKIVSEAKQGGISFNIIEKCFDYVFTNPKLKYNYTFVKLPNWSTNYKGYEINGDLYTHLIIDY